MTSTVGWACKKNRRAVGHVDRNSNAWSVRAKAVGLLGRHGGKVVCAPHTHDARPMNLRNPKHRLRTRYRQQPTMILVDMFRVVAPLPAQVQRIEGWKACAAGACGKAVAEGRGDGRGKHERDHGAVGSCEHLTFHGLPDRVGP